MLICVRWEKSMCLAAKGRLQGWAAKLLLLWVGIFHFFSFQIFNHVTAVSFFGLRTTPGGMKRSGFRSCYVSTETDFATSCDAHITNAPALFYDRLLGGVNHSFLTKLIVPFTNPFLSPSDDINKSPFS